MVMEQAEEALRKLQVPDWVERLTIERYRDHADDLALRIWVVVKPDRLSILEDDDAVPDISEQVRAAIRATGIELFPYVEFISADAPEVA